MGENLEFGLVVRSRRGKPPIRDKDGDNKKRNPECHSERYRCQRRFNFGDDDDDDEMAAASQVGQASCGGGGGGLVGSEGVFDYFQLYFYSLFRQEC